MGLEGEKGSCAAAKQAHRTGTHMELHTQENTSAIILLYYCGACRVLSAFNINGRKLSQNKHTSAILHALGKQG